METESSIVGRWRCCDEGADEWNTKKKKKKKMATQSARKKMGKKQVSALI
jgi:hypothetical protein